MPVVFQQQVMVVTVQNPVEIPQLQVLVKVVDMPAVVQRQVSMILTLQKARGDSTVAGLLTCLLLCNDRCP